MQETSQTWISYKNTYDFVAIRSKFFTWGSFGHPCHMVLWLSFTMDLSRSWFFVVDAKCHSCKILYVKIHVRTECEKCARRHSDCILQWFLHNSLTGLWRVWGSEGLHRRSQSNCYLQHFDNVSALLVFCRRVQPRWYFRGFDKI